MTVSRVYEEDIETILSDAYPWDALEGHSVLVTGATGMIGSVLTDALARMAVGHRFRVTAMSRNRTEMESLFSRHADNPSFRTVQHDVNIPMDGLGCDTVFHLASNTHPAQYASDPIGTVTTNVIGLRNLLEMSTSAGEGRFVFASSVEVYGENRGDVDRFDESYCGYIDCNTVRAGYNESKRLGESLCQAYGSQKGLDFVIPRLSRIYGPTLRRGDTKALSQFIGKAVAGEDIVLKSAGTQLFSYCYSADAVSALLHLLFHGESGNAYNVAGLDSDITLRDLAGILADIAGREVVFEIPETSESRGYSKATKATLDIGKMEAIGWHPRFSIRDGLVRTVSALRSRSA